MKNRFLAGLHWVQAFIALFACVASSEAATRVDLLVDEPKPARVVPWPITTGVPFPRGHLADIRQCRLVDDTGKECVLQAKVAATWDAMKTSIRWLTIDFIAQPGRKYALEYGPDVTTLVNAEQPLRIIAEGVSTGAITARFAVGAGTALGDISLVTDKRDLPVILGGEHYAVDQDGRRYSSARDGADRKIVVETAGPVRGCIRVDGYYTGPDGRRIVRYRTRYHFFAGLPLIKVVDEFRVIGSTRGVRWKDVGFALQLAKAEKARTIAVDVSGDKGTETLRLAAQPGESIASFQRTYRHYGNPDCVGGVARTGAGSEQLLRQTDRIGEWMQIADERAVVTGSLRWLWQQFPKEWEATSDNRLVLHLWSPRGGELDFGADGIRRFLGPAGEKYLLKWQGVVGALSPISNYFFFASREPLERGDGDGLGIAKHHEFYLHFAPPGQAERGQDYGRLAAQPPLALASGKWNCSTDVFGPLAPRPNNHAAEGIVDRLFDLGRKAQDDFGDYGWWVFGSGPHYSYQWDPQTKSHYADARRFEYHTYQKETQLWWNYFRSGERKFLDWALPSENHWVDIAVSHEPTKFHTQWQGPDRKPADLHWPRGDWSIDSPLHYLRHHNTGEAWLRGQSQYWASYHRTLETTSLAYYLTGDERFNEVLGYWRDYWGDLAGKTNESADLKPWHREQAWYRPVQPGEKPKTWAELIRDYAPFTSGSRHQLTLFFNLATLYEHDWDPKVGMALREYAAAFLDPESPFGAWRSQENRGPARAQAPLMAHFWLPALWKYARASADPAMPAILRRYCDACLGADPFHEDVGVYSNVHIGYGYYFTKDPGHLRAAVRELDRLRPHGEPLARPEDLGERLYNPYGPAASFTAVPRLLWALEEAQRRGVAIPPPPPTHLQRTATAFIKSANSPVTLTLWGFDREPHLIGPDRNPYRNFTVQTKSFPSAIHPFDRIQPGFAVYRHQMTIPAAAPAGWYLVAPKLEMAVLDLSGPSRVICNASVPMEVQPGEAWKVRLGGEKEIRLESASPGSFRVVGANGKQRPATTMGGMLVVPLGQGEVGQFVRIENIGKGPAWFRLAGLPVEHCWVATTEKLLEQTPKRDLTLAALPPPMNFDPMTVYTEGRFGKGLLLVPGREFRIPDGEKTAGAPITNAKLGTIEFWIKRLWDDRLVAAPRGPLVTNGEIEIPIPKNLPLGEWAHVAISWFPHRRGPSQTVVHVYVNGLDTAFYRNFLWRDYGDQPTRFPSSGKRRPEVTFLALPGTAFALDEIRFSRNPRYADPTLDFGSQQSFNPFHFKPPMQVFPIDEATTRLFHLDGNAKDAARPMGIEGRVEQEKRK